MTGTLKPYWIEINWQPSQWIRFASIYNNFLRRTNTQKAIFKTNEIYFQIVLLVIKSSKRPIPQIIIGSFYLFFLLFTRSLLLSTFLSIPFFQADTLIQWSFYFCIFCQRILKLFSAATCLFHYIIQLFYFV